MDIVSFFYPEYMVNMNDEFFTFKDGQIYVHNQQEAQGIRFMVRQATLRWSL